MDELIDGKIMGWPVSAQLIRNPGERGLCVQVAPYTDASDSPAPRSVHLACQSVPFEHPDKKSAMVALKAAGFIPGELE